MASPKATSLALTTFLVNGLNLKEQLQDLDVDGTNTTVDARGIADRYAYMQVTKQKQAINFTAHWYNNSTSLEATNLDITVWTLGGTAYVGQLKSGTLDITNAGPETSGISEAYEFPQPTSTSVNITSETMVIAEALWTASILTDTVAQFPVTVAIAFAGEVVNIPGILKSSKHSVKRGEVQMDNPVIELHGTPTTPGDTTSLIYLALIGSAVCTFDADTGVNEYKNGSGQTFMISKVNMRFADKALIQQSVTLEPQGGMTVIAA